MSSGPGRRRVLSAGISTIGGRNRPAHTRIALRPLDPYSGEEIEREEVAKSYEYECREFVTFTLAELKALDVESSKIIDLETFVPRTEVDPAYFSTYYVYPDGPTTFRVIGAAMAEAGKSGSAALP
jgi:DNA end-binding protein Ku